MAQKVQVLLVDDMDGGEADETVSFGVDGKVYEIDLRTENADKLREVLAPYVKAGRRQRGKDTARSARSASSAPSDTSTNAAIRQWARDNGVEMNARGRIPEWVRQRFLEAQK